MRQRFYIGDRVKVRIATDVIPEEEINCDVGMVYGINLIHPSAPELHRIVYKILLDAPYGKVIYKKIHVQYDEGFNILQANQRIELIKGNP